MHVGISLLALAPDGSGGSETYARELVRALGRVGGLEYTVFVPEHARDAADGLPAVAVRDVRRGPRSRSRIPGLGVAAPRARELPAKVDGLDVLHYPLAVSEPRADAPTVATVRDVQLRELPELFGPTRRASRHVAYERAVREADAVVVPSEFAKARVAERLELSETRVHVVPRAVDHELFRPGEEQRGPFVLYPARPWAHKNHPRLLEAFAVLRTTRPRLRLVLTGAGLERLGPLPEGVERWGEVPPDRLASLYRRAACVVYPSLDEPFGLPPLEAMASGCPVAAANAGAIPEVCGDAAVLFDPLDPEAIAAAVVETDERRDELVARGLERAAQFTWDEAARRHDAVYREVGS